MLLLIACSIQLNAQTCPSTQFVGLVELNTSDAIIRWETNLNAQSYHITIERNSNIEVNNELVPIMGGNVIDYNYIISPNAFASSDYLDIEVVTTCFNGSTSSFSISGFIGSIVTVEEVYSGKDANDIADEVCPHIKYHWVDDSKPYDSLGHDINANTNFYGGSLANPEGEVRRSISDYLWIKQWKFPLHPHIDKLEDCWKNKRFTLCTNPAYGLFRLARKPKVCDEYNGNSNRLYLLDSKISPNPINQNAIITFDLPNEDFVNIALYDLQGKQVQTIVETKAFSEGLHAIQFDRGSLATGLYQIMITTTDNIEMLKVVISE